MSRRIVFTTISPLPTGVGREVVIDSLHNHLEMIDLNPLVKERHPIKPPSNAPADEINCVWYSLTDRVAYLPGGLASGDISYTCAFHDLPDGLQTHCRAPLNVEIREKWTLCGTLPGEPAEPVELGIGAPATGLYIREDVDLRCNFLLTGFVRRTLKKSHATLVEHLVDKARHGIAGEKDKILNCQSPSSAVVEKPLLFLQPQPEHSQASNADAREEFPSGSASETPDKSPHFGSPFVPGYQPGRPSSLRHSSLHEGLKARNAPASISHHRSLSQDADPPSRLEPHCQTACLPSMHAHPALRSQSPQHCSLPSPGHPNSALYPEPLRLRNLSPGPPNLTMPQPIPSGCSAPRLSSAPAASTAGRPSVSEPRTSSDHHPSEYPELNPYSDASSSPDEPRTPQFFAELVGSEALDKAGQAAGSAYVDHPAVLRPGRAGMSGRLEPPSAAALE